MPTLKDDVAKLSNGAQLTYLDTGAPEDISNYRTFVFVHGAVHNKCNANSTVTNCRQGHGSHVFKLRPRTLEQLLSLNADTKGQLL
jgi:hypothetical protein